MLASNSSSAIECNGKLIVFSGKKPYQQLWFIAKNIEKDHIVQLSSIYNAKQECNCGYSDDIEHLIAGMEQNLFIRQSTDLESS